jgi:hypothetical protein
MRKEFEVRMLNEVGKERAKLNPIAGVEYIIDSELNIKMEGE